MKLITEHNLPWKCLKCDECNQIVPKIIQIGEDPDYRSATVEICEDCLFRAVALMVTKPKEGG
jgi:hypothetical protein